jgi:hypothetical protein
VFVLASAFDIHDRVARDPALELRAELARRAEVLGNNEELVVDRVRRRSTMMRSSFNMKRQTAPSSPYPLNRIVDQ